MSEVEVDNVYGTTLSSDVYELLIPEKVTIFTCTDCKHSIIKSHQDQALVEVPEKKIILT